MKGEADRVDDGGAFVEQPGQPGTGSNGDGEVHIVRNDGHSSEPEKRGLEPRVVVRVKLPPVAPALPNYHWVERLMRRNQGLPSPEPVPKVALFDDLDQQETQHNFKNAQEQKSATVQRFPQEALSVLNMLHKEVHQQELVESVYPTGKCSQTGFAFPEKPAARATFWPSRQTRHQSRRPLLWPKTPQPAASSISPFQRHGVSEDL